MKKYIKKITGKPQWACCVCSFAYMIQFNHLKVYEKRTKTQENFIGFFSMNLTKDVKKTRGEIFYTFAGMISLMLNSKLLTI